MPQHSFPLHNFIDPCNSVSHLMSSVTKGGGTMGARGALPPLTLWPIKQTAY